VDDPKPLHVQVAEALGTKLVPMTLTSKDAPPVFQGWMAVASPYHLEQIPRYDTDWSATGPLIEKYRINIGAPSPQDSCVWVNRPADGDPALRMWDSTTEMLGCADIAVEGETPLIAVCHLILALSKAGKLKENP
jgi:hypothetical protein